MTTDDAKSYLSKREIPRLFESLMTGLMYHRPTNHIQYLIECLQKVKEKGQEDITWSSFVDIRRGKTPLPPISRNDKKRPGSKGSRPSSNTRAKTPQGDGPFVRIDTFVRTIQGNDVYSIEMKDIVDRVVSPLSSDPPVPESTLRRRSFVETDQHRNIDLTANGFEDKKAKDVAAPTPQTSFVVDDKLTLPDIPIVFLMGAPGSGKNHQVQRLLLRYDGWIQLNMGDLIRAEIKDRGSGHAKWRMTRELLSRGEPAQEDVIGSVLFGALKRCTNAKGIIISGFPRSLDQVAEFDKHVGRVDVVFILDCEEQSATDRLLRKGKESRRPEDTLTAIANRVKFFKAHTLPAAKHFDDQGKLVVIDGDRRPQEVEHEFGKAFDNIFFSKYGSKKLEDTVSPRASPPPPPPVYKKQFEGEPDIPKDKPLFVGAVPQPPQIESKDEGRKPDLPQCPIIFVAGGPGSGKGSQCQRIIQRYPDFVHLSMGDILRTEITTKGTADDKWDMITKLLQHGEMAPEDVTIDLLKDSLKKHMDAKAFVIEGYPRDKKQVECFNKSIGGLNFVILFDCEEYYMQTRLMQRGKTSGRIDDNLSAIANKIEFYKYNTLPIMKYYDDLGKLVVLDADRDMDEMFYDISNLFDFAFFAKKPDGAKDTASKDTEHALAASKIQAGFRGFKVRHEMDKKSKQEKAELRTDEEKLLGKPITYLTETKPESEKNKLSMAKEEATVKIQAGFKAHQTRKEMRPEYKKKVSKVNTANVEDTAAGAANKILGGFRGYKTRKGAMMKKGDTTKQTSVKKQETKEESLKAKHDHQPAAKIQAGFRGYQKRKQQQNKTTSKKVTKTDTAEPAEEEVVEETVVTETAITTGDTIANPSYSAELDQAAADKDQAKSS